MADLTGVIGDPTLDAVDAAIEAKQDKSTRPYLGMSAIGGECARALWYTFRFCTTPHFEASTLKLFEDGHRGEDLQAERLRLVDGVQLLTVDDVTGRQFAMVDHGGHFRGHMDGAIHGLLQAQKTWHVWEHKQVSEDKFAKLLKLKSMHDEKEVFAKWDTTYYGQGQLYMNYTGMKRHYLTVSTPGGRKTTSVRTEYNSVDAMKLVARAESIIFSVEPPPRLSNDPTWYACKPYGKLCVHHDVCHGTRVPNLSCRTCCHATPERDGDGMWSCSKHKSHIPIAVQRAGCGEHLPLPFLLSFGETIDAGNDWILFKDKRNESYFAVVAESALPPADVIEQYHPLVFRSSELLPSFAGLIGDAKFQEIRATFGGRVTG